MPGSVDGEATAGDAIGIATDEGAKIGRMVKVILQPLETQDQRPIDAGEPDVADGGAEADHFDGEISGGEAPFLNPRAVRHGAEMH